jgi:hypothetical protein
MTHRPGIVLTLILLLVGLASAPAANAQLGVAAGLNFESFDDLDFGSSSATFDNATGYHAGVFYDLGLGLASVRLGVFYRDIGNVAVTVAGGGNEYLFDLNMIDVPVDLRFNLTATPAVRPYILAGPVFSFPNSGDDTFGDELETVSVSGAVGAGVQIGLGALTLYPEVRYGVGISRFMNDSFDIGGTTFTSDNTQRLNSVMLRLGIGF